MKQGCLIFLWVLFSFSISAQSIKNTNQYIWYGNDNFFITENNNECTIEFEKKSWERFTLYIGEYDFSTTSNIVLEIKSVNELNLGVQLVDINNKMIMNMPTIKHIKSDGEFKTLNYDFSGYINKADEKRVSQIKFYVNPGLDYSGSITLRNITIGNLTTLTENKINSINLYPNPANSFINIESSNISFDQISILDLSGRVLIQNIFSEQNNARLSLNKLNRGIYILQVISNNQVIYLSKFAH